MTDAEQHNSLLPAGHRLNQMTCDTLDIIGYSVAGEETVIAVPSLDVCFDVGKAPDEILPINHVLLTHGHMDHAAGIAYYCSQRDFREMVPGTVLLPERLARDIDALLDCWGRIDGTRPPVKMIPMKPGDEYEVRRNLFAFAFATNHVYGSLGFTLIERRQKLKPEYLYVPGQEIARLRKEGVTVTYTMNMPLVSYLGDTMGGDFEQLACVRQSKVLLAECTFFDPDHHDRAQAGRHYHIDQLAQFLQTTENEFILLTHLSRRTDLRTARKMLSERLPEEVLSRVRFLMERPRRGGKKKPVENE